MNYTLYRFVLTIIVSIPKFIVKRVRIGEEKLDDSPFLLVYFIITIMMVLGHLIPSLIQSFNIGLMIGIPLLILNGIIIYSLILIIIGIIE